VNSTRGNLPASLLLALLALMVLPGCNPLAPQPDPTRYYVLTPMAGSGQSIVASANSGIIIGLGPVTLPDYLDQQWMVSRGEGNQLYVSSHDQWGEPLRDSFKDVLKQDLATELSEDEIIDYPWYRTTAVDRQIMVDLVDFEFNNFNHAAQIRANWSMLNVRTSAMEAHGQFVAAQSTPANASAQERAAALSKLVNQLARMLAQQIRRTPAIAQGAGAKVPAAPFGG
jgi:uncharacterized lipoprotein YmbA